MERSAGAGDSGRAWLGSLSCALVNAPAHSKRTTVSILLIFLSFLFCITLHFQFRAVIPIPAQRFLSHGARIENTRTIIPGKSQLPERIVLRAEQQIW